MTEQNRRRCFGALFAAIATLSCVSPSNAADPFPNGTMRIIVPLAAGGVIDALARAIGKVVQEKTGFPVIVENRPGASSIIGMTACARAQANGNTICIANADPLSYGPSVFELLPYDADRDFTPITNLGWTNNLIVANIKSAFNTYPELISYAKTHPGELNWATWGASSLPDLYLRWLERSAGVSIVAVPFAGAAQGNPAVYFGQTHLTYMGAGTAIPQIAAGVIKPIVGIGQRRLSYFPDLPTLAEYGGDPNLPSYFGVFGPAKLPENVVSFWNDHLKLSLKDPQVLQIMKASTVDPLGNSSAEFAAFMREDRANASKVFKQLGINPSKAP